MSCDYLKWADVAEVCMCCSVTTGPTHRARTRTAVSSTRATTAPHSTARATGPHICTLAFQDRR